ncbi:fumarylacetoacetate hydrolase family protein [Nonomuraea jabiensis]|uniref:fumarylacetoacetate hydrolase family protein n=1 Tax=Nonomuraea jabiensis TaxID=882448 RepID=UPI0034206C4D
MTNAPWADGVGVGRARLDGGSVMVLHRPDTSEAHLATVDGRTFSDLPALLEAAEGQVHRIRPGAGVAPAHTDLLSPVGRPRKIVCVGQNYAAHVSETGRPSAPPYPDLFAKWDNALSGPYDEIVLPSESEQIDFESELAVVIGRRCRRVAAEDVESVVFGYTVANDGSVRDYQFHSGQRTAGKAWDRLTPLGPVVVPADRLGGAWPDLRMTGLLNGEIVQDDRTSGMIHGVPRIVSYVSTFMTLEPGDLILTGTPAGVGAVRNPPRYLTAGDDFEVRIEGIGALRNRYRAEKPR